MYKQKLGYVNINWQERKSCVMLSAKQENSCRSFVSYSCFDTSTRWRGFGVWPYHDLPSCSWVTFDLLWMVDDDLDWQRPISSALGFFNLCKKKHAFNILYIDKLYVFVVIRLCMLHTLFVVNFDILFCT
jgi:hypothetical protein